MSRVSKSKHKVIFLGDSSTGKTSIINKYLGYTQQPQATVGVCSWEISIRLQNATVNIVCWDTAGQEAYRSLVSSYARGAEVAIIVYDQSNTGSFESLPKWINYVEDEAGIKSAIIVSNKSDLETVVPFDRASAFCCDRNLPLVATSAVTGNNIQLLFTKVAEIIYERSYYGTSMEETINLEEREQQNKKNCC